MEVEMEVMVMEGAGSIEVVMVMEEATTEVVAVADVSLVYIIHTYI